MKRITVVAIAVVLLMIQSTSRADNSYYRVLAVKPNATFADAVRVFFELTLNVDAGALTFKEQAKALADMGVIRKEWMKDPDMKLTRGRTAYMICEACRIWGGLTMWVWGNSERYAYRECVFNDVWRGGNQRNLMTGGELMGVLKWAVDYLELNPGKMVQPAGSALAAVESARTRPKPIPKGPATSPKKTTPTSGDSTEAAPAESTPETTTGDMGTTPAEARTGEGTAITTTPATSIETPDADIAKPTPADVTTTVVPTLKETPYTAETAEPVAVPEPDATGPGTVKGGIYVVRQGDTIGKVAQKFYGDAGYLYLILRANKLKVTDRLHVGQRLVIPPVTPRMPAK